jgi:hypothetical protein
VKVCHRSKTEHLEDLVKPARQDIEHARRGSNVRAMGGPTVLVVASRDGHIVPACMRHNGRGERTLGWRSSRRAFLSQFSLLLLPGLRGRKLLGTLVLGLNVYISILCRKDRTKTKGGTKFRQEKGKKKRKTYEIARHDCFRLKDCESYIIHQINTHRCSFSSAGALLGGVGGTYSLRLWWSRRERSFASTKRIYIPIYASLAVSLNCLIHLEIYLLTQSSALRYWDYDREISPMIFLSFLFSNTFQLNS